MHSCQQNSPSALQGSRHTEEKLHQSPSEVDCTGDEVLSRGKNGLDRVEEGEEDGAEDVEDGSEEGGD